MTNYGNREKCYKCYRPKFSCMCKHVCKVDTKTKFVILMHPKEFKKVKNGSGFFTHLSLPNSELFIDDNFTNHKRVNEIIDTHYSLVLYPNENSINISKQNFKIPKEEKLVIFILDATWSCAKTMLRDSLNLKKLDSISFTTSKLSRFDIKQQPHSYCLSTIESTLCVLEELNIKGIESINQESIDLFLNPFLEMVKYQKNIILNSHTNTTRFK